MLKFISNHSHKKPTLKYIIKCAMIGFLGIKSLCAFATTAEQKAFEQAVDNAIYSHINARHNILALVSGYAYDGADIENLPLDKIKVYTVFEPKILQCVYQHSQPNAYQKALQQSMKSYYQQVDDEQFKEDLAYITDEKRQVFYGIQKQSMKLYAQMPNVELGKNISTGDAAKISKIEHQLQALNDQYPDVLATDWSRDIDRLMNDESRVPLLNLLGLSLANMPFDEEQQNLPISPMSIYTQKVIDDCHKPFWQRLHHKLQQDHGI